MGYNIHHLQSFLREKGFVLKKGQCAVPSRGARIRKQKVKQYPYLGVSQTRSLFGKNNKGFKVQKGEQCYSKCIVQLCSCRSLKRKRGFGHLLFFRNPCRGRNLLNNNVTFIQWDMTFKNKGQWRVSLLCSVAQIQNTEFELNVTPSAFVSSGPFVVIATTLPPLANPF